MGLWTAAEMTTGIIVSCLPVMPRSFQNLNHRIYGTLSHNSKTLSEKFESLSEKFAQKSVSSADNSKGGQRRASSGKFKRGGGGGDEFTSASETLQGSYISSPGVGSKRDYVTLDDGFEMATLERGDNVPRRPARAVAQVGRATRREDVEAGMYTA